MRDHLRYGSMIIVEPRRILKKIKNRHDWPNKKKYCYRQVKFGVCKNGRDVPFFAWASMASINVYCNR